MGENIFKWSNWQRINLQNIQIAHGAHYQKHKQFNQKYKQLSQKMGRKPKSTSLQRIYTEGQQTHEKMLYLTNY